MITHVEHVMGTAVSISVDPGSGDPAAAISDACAALHAADQTFSTFKAGSALSRHRRGEPRAEELPDEMLEVLELSARAARLTGGFFDPWAMPGGFDPTGLVKGWAVERAATVLDRLEGYAHSVNAGGDIALGGHDATGPARPWRIGIEDPRDRSRIAEVVEMVRGGVATSGTAARGAHLWDPERQEWVRRIGSVTVVGPSLLWADIWATALFVGPPGLVQELPRLEPDYRAIVL